MRFVTWVLRAATAILPMALAACGGSSPPIDEVGARVSTDRVAYLGDYRRPAPAYPVSFRLDFDRALAGTAATVQVEHTRNNIRTIQSVDNSAGTELRIDLLPLWGSTSDALDRIDLKLCLDAACTLQAKGSPFTVYLRVRYGTRVPPEAGIEPLAVASRVTLPVNVYAVKFSAALDALVIASRVPAPALHVYDLKSGALSTLALGAGNPIDLALSPDGRRAYVTGFRQLSTFALSSPAAGNPTLLSTQALPFDQLGTMVIDGRDRLHVFGRPFGSESLPLRTIDLASGAISGSKGNTQGVIDAVLHPGGERLYFANTNLNPFGSAPRNLWSFDLRGDAPGPPRPSPLQGGTGADAPDLACGRVWLSRQGDRLLTGCGKVYLSSADPALDMQLAADTPAPWISSSASFSLDDRRAVVIERTPQCQPSNAQTFFSCTTRVVTYDTSNWSVVSRFGIQPVELGEEIYGQQGTLIFHRNDGSIALLGTMGEAPTPTALMQLSYLR